MSASARRNLLDRLAPEGPSGPGGHAAEQEIERLRRLMYTAVGYLRATGEEAKRRGAEDK